MQNSEVAVDNGELHSLHRWNDPTVPYGKVLLRSDPLATANNITIYQTPDVVSKTYVPIGNDLESGTPIYQTHTTVVGPQSTALWALVGLTAPANPPPAGERPSATITQTDSEGTQTTLPNPAASAWDSAAAPYLALQAKIDALRAQMNANMVIVQAYNAYTATTEKAEVSAGTPGSRQ